MMKFIRFSLFYLLGAMGVAGADIAPSVITNEICFNSNGSGTLTIKAAAPTLESIQRMFGFTEPNITEAALRSALSNSFSHINFTESSYEYNAVKGVYINYIYKFDSPSNIVEWLDDNRLVRGKYIRWSADVVECNFEFTENYDFGFYLEFEFHNYAIIDVNGILMDSRRCLWKFGPNSRSVYLVAVREKLK